MPAAFFRVRLSVRPKSGGEAELVPPSVLQGLNYSFVTVKDGGEEAIITLEGSQAVLDRVEKNKDCDRLTPREKEKLQKSYPVPKLKKKYRVQPQFLQAGEAVAVGEQFEVDDRGHRIVDTIQTVRAGFYLIDVPVFVESAGG